jgi:hypothetical protein
MRAERPEADEARPAAVGKLFSEAMWTGEAESFGREGFLSCEEAERRELARCCVSAGFREQRASREQTARPRGEERLEGCPPPKVGDPPVERPQVMQQRGASPSHKDWKTARRRSPRRPPRSGLTQVALPTRVRDHSPRLPSSDYASPASISLFFLRARSAPRRR